MTWLDQIVADLAAHPVCDYRPNGRGAAEPTALAGLLLAGSELAKPARSAAEWLAAQQAEDGSVGVRQGERTPCWTTGWAVLLWQRLGADFDRPRERGLAWILAMKGKTQLEAEYVGHDTTLTGWPWAEGTHSWIEPTAVQVLALRATGHAEHPRTREAVRLLLDRQLPSGGCNYGNTTVLDRELRPHVQPTGLALLALAGESDRGDRMRRSLEFLAKSLSPRTTPASLGWALLGLTAHGQRPDAANEWLAASFERYGRVNRSPYQLALLGLAARGGI